MIVEEVFGGGKELALTKLDVFSILLIKRCIIINDFCFSEKACQGRIEKEAAVRELIFWVNY